MSIIKKAAPFLLSLLLPLFLQAEETTEQFVMKLEAKYYSCTIENPQRSLASEKDVHEGTLLVYNPNKIALLEFPAVDRNVWWVSRETAIAGSPGPCENGCGYGENLTKLSLIPKEWSYICTPLLKNKHDLPFGGSADQDKIVDYPI